MFLSIDEEEEDSPNGCAGSGRAGLRGARGWSNYIDLMARVEDVGGYWVCSRGMSDLVLSGLQRSTVVAVEHVEGLGECSAGEDEEE